MTVSIATAFSAALIPLTGFAFWAPPPMGRHPCARGHCRAEDRLPPTLDCITLSITPEMDMAANQLVQARIDGAVKAEASAVLAAIGLTVSDAVRLMLTRVAREHALPFDPLIPNPTTVAAMMEARAGNLPSVNSIEDLMAELDADD